MEPGRELRRRTRVLLAAVVLGVTVVAATAVVVSGKEHRVLSVEQIATVCAGDMPCIADTFVEAMTDVAADVPLLPDLAQRTGVRCHLLSHEVGERAFSRFGAKVFDLHEEQCGSGFTHGWMVAYAKRIANPDEIPSYDALHRYCNEAPDRWSCLHGVGHSLASAAVSGGTASQVCHIVAGINTLTSLRGPTENCIEGYAMGVELDAEWASTNTDPTGTFTQMCGPVSAGTREYCISMLYRRWLENAGEFRPERVETFAATCDALRGRDYDVCYMELGETLVVMLGKADQPVAEQIAMTNRFCPDGVTVCVTAQVAAMGNQIADPTSRITGFCAGLRASLRQWCEVPEPSAASKGSK